MGAQTSSPTITTDEIRHRVLSAMQRVYGPRDNSPDKTFQEGIRQLKTKLSTYNDTDNVPPPFRIEYLRQLIRAFMKSDHRLNTDRVIVGIGAYACMEPATRSMALFEVLCSEDARKRISYTPGMGVGNTAARREQWRQLVRKLVNGLPLFVLEASLGNGSPLQKCRKRDSDAAHVSENHSAMGIAIRVLRTQRDAMRKAKEVRERQKRHSEGAEALEQAIKDIQRDKQETKARIRAHKNVRTTFEEGSIEDFRHKRLVERSTKTLEALQNEEKHALALVEHHHRKRREAGHKIVIDAALDTPAAEERKSNADKTMKKRNRKKEEERIATSGTVQEVVDRLLLEDVSHHAGALMWCIVCNSNVTMADLAAEIRKRSKEQRTRMCTMRITRLLATKHTEIKKVVSC